MASSEDFLSTSQDESSHEKVDLSQLLQLRAIYELTTSITNQCFDTCLGRLNPRMEESEKNCISNCAANFMHMKLLFTSRLVETVRSFNDSDTSNNKTL